MTLGNFEAIVMSENDILILQPLLSFTVCKRETQSERKEWLGSGDSVTRGKDNITKLEKDKKI